MSRGERLSDLRRLVWLSGRLVGGRYFWAAPLLPLAWPGFVLFQLAVGWRESDSVGPDAMQVGLIGFPLTVLAIGLGMRIIAGEIDGRTLEIAFTVPGGTSRVWLAKLAAALALIVAAEAVLALAAFLFFSAYPPGALYGALQGAVVYLVVSMGLSTLFKSEATGALVTAGVLLLNAVITGFGDNQIRPSPFWNPAAPSLGSQDPADLLAWTVQNRIGFALVIVTITLLTFARAERRERMLGG